MKKNSKTGDSPVKWHSISVAALLILVVLLSAGSGIYAGASFFAQQAPNVTVTTTIYTTTTSWTTSTIWSAVTSTVLGVLTTVQYTTSTSTVTVTGLTSTSVSTQVAGGTGSNYGTSKYAVFFCSFSASASGTVSKVGVNLVAASGNAMTGIYSDSGGNAYSLLGSSSSTALSGAGWNDLSLTTPVHITKGTTYWLAVQFSSSNANVYGNPSGGKFESNTYGSLPNPASVSGSATALNLRITYVPD